MKKNSDIRLITFDLDNTLWDPLPALQRAEQVGYRWLCEQVPLFAAQFSIDDLTSIRFALFEQHTKYRHQISQLRIDALAAALKQCRQSSARSRMLAQQAFDQVWLERNKVDLFCETEKLLHQLSKDFYLGALTNGNADVDQVGIGHYFAFQYSAEQLNASKPLPDQFLKALDHFTLQPTQMIHIGDHPTDDIQGAAAIGIYSIWANLDGQDWPVQELSYRPTKTVSCLSEIPRAIEDIRLI